MLEFIQSLLGDEFLSKAFILSLITGSLIYLRGIPKIIWSRIRRLIVFSVTVEQTDELFDYVERWLKDNYSEKYRNVLANINYRNFAMDSYEVSKDIVAPNSNSSFKNDNKTEKIHYRHNQDTIFIRRNGFMMRINKGRDKLEHAQSFTNIFFDSYTISTFFFKKKIQQLLDDIVEYNQQFKLVEDDRVIIWSFDGYNNWKKVRNINPKKVENIVLDNKIKDLILIDIKLFTEKRDWYNDRFIPYKRGYVFYGDPGNGKTSMSLALAHYLEKDIYTLSISEVASDGDLKYLFSNIDDNSILLIEDIDAVFTGRRSKGKVTFSALLNCLDGIFYKDGIITIMTTNHIDKLDNALTRDGRVDLKVNFENPKSKEVRKYVELFYDIKLNGEVYKQDYSMAKIQNYCLNNNEHEILTELFN